MRPLRPAHAAVLLLVALAPAALAQGADLGDALCVIFVTPSPDFRAVEIVVDLILDDAERERLMRGADADGDGSITAEEVDAFEASSARSIARGELAERRLLMDNELPDHTLVWTRLGGFVGPVDASRNVTASEVREYAFNGTAGGRSVHRMIGGVNATYEPQPVVETVVITAPEGWVVSRVNGTAYGESEVVIRGFDTRTLFRMDFTWEGEGRPPGSRAGPIPLSPALAVGALAAAAAVAASLSARRSRER